VGLREKLLNYRTKDIIRTDVNTVQACQKVSRAREIMRLKQSAGLVVLDNNGQVLGIITMENLVRAQEEGMMEQPVELVMSKHVVTVNLNADIREILDCFCHHRIRQLPVVDENRHLVGIITVDKILDILRQLIEGDREAQVKKNGDVFRMSFDVEAGNFQRAGEAATGVKNTLRDLGGFPPDLVRRVGVVAYEAETNIVIHSLGGNMELVVQPKKIIMVFSDRGPGIPDIEKARQPGFSTAPDHVKEMGFGAGMGFSNMEKSTDQLEIQSEAGGKTFIKATFFVDE